MARKKREVVRGVFTCGECSKTYSRSASLHRHQRSHRGEIPFTCHVCSKRFFDNYNLRVHMRTHTGEKPLSCPSCLRKFADKSQLLHHQQMRHSLEKPFTCQHCDKSFAVMWSYNLHMRYHKDERKFGCPHCPKKFALRHALKRHLASHSDTRPFNCPDCDKSYPSRHYLSIHRRQVHKVRVGKGQEEEPGLTCPDCCASFPTEEGLHSHFRIHEILKEKCHSLFDVEADLFPDSPESVVAAPPEEADPSQVLEELLASKEAAAFDPSDAAEEFDAAQGLNPPPNKDEEETELHFEDDCSELINKCIEENEIDLKLIEEMGEEGERLIEEDALGPMGYVIVIDDEILT